MIDIEAELKEMHEKIDKILSLLLNHCERDGGECSICAKIICPHGDDMHYHHDGCPQCEKPLN